MDSGLIGLVCAGLGDMDEALQWLERAYGERSDSLTWLNAPLYDGLRSPPRFEALVRRMKFPE